MFRFQDKTFAKDPINAKTKKRYAVGLREAIKYLKVTVLIANVGV